MADAIEGAERAEGNLQEILRPHQRHDFVAALQDAEYFLNDVNHIEKCRSFNGLGKVSAVECHLV
jgi:hypothetical protein